LAPSEYVVLVDADAGIGRLAHGVVADTADLKLLPVKFALG